MHCELARISAKGANLGEAMFTDSKLSRLALEGCTLAALDLGGSKLDGFSLSGATLDGPVSAKGAVVKGLSLAGVRLGKGYRLDDAGTVYEAGDRFPRGAGKP